MIDEIRWKFVAAVTIIAMAVSLISGGLSGISFGVLAVRALAGGVIFAILAVALNLLIARLFPEILETEPAIEGDPDAPGGRVDITMPPENPAFYGEDNDSPGQAGTEGFGQTSDDNVADVEPVDEQTEPSIDSLGDLDRFSGAFSEVDDASEADGRTTKGSGGGQDPEELAQAIHTVLKRDEKG